MRNLRRTYLLGLFLFLLLAVAGRAAEKQWFKGNVHCHSLWSDGNSFPECVVDWYKNRGYHFLALTDHNVFQTGDKWVSVAPRQRRGAAGQAAYDKYKKTMSGQVEEKGEGDKKLVRLKTYKELAPQFNEPGKFLLIPGEEITCPDPKGTNYRVHVCAMNITEQIEPPAAPEGMKNPNTWQANESGRLVAEQSKAAGIPMHAHLNHPLWSHFEFDQVCLVDRLNQMELNNDDSGSSTALIQTMKLWDTVLAHRLSNNKPLMLGLAVDDAHSHQADQRTAYGAGHGWVMVRAERLAPADIVNAIEAGDFYSTRGPELLDIKYGRREMTVLIKGEPGVSYSTQFVGRRKDGQPGEVLATVQGLSPIYKIQGDEIYVRAQVTSSKVQPDKEGKPAYAEMAWTQPYQPRMAK